MLDGLKKPLFIFEMANNHQGSIKNGLRIIREIAEVCKSFEFNFAFKFQYRDLDTFIHPAYINSTANKNIKRFIETRLTREDLRLLKKEADLHGFITICTPFDEPSVDLIVEHEFDVIKIASCSVGDWPLLEKVAAAGKPVIASTAGSDIEDIDKLVNFFTNRGIDLAVMHCVAEYPTTNEGLQLNQIDLLQRRYVQVPIGFSTHEKPDNYDAIKIAVAKNARIFEKHVGIDNPDYPLNAYSATPEQVRLWLDAARDAYAICGIPAMRHKSTNKEKADLLALRRGVFARRPLSLGQRLNRDDFFLAFPAVEEQLTSQYLSKYNEITTAASITTNAPIMLDQVSIDNNRSIVEQVLTRVLDLVNDGNLIIPVGSASELSHHKGLANFEECGATIINCLNREYCKKYIILLPGQSHPMHFHRLKEETFTVVHGQMDVEIDGKKTVLAVGESATIERGAQHSFSSEKGAIMEEISTTHHLDDSYYEENAIDASRERKTSVYLTSDFFKYRSGRL